MARYGDSAPYFGKGQKAMADRMAKLLAAGATFDPPVKLVGKDGHPKYTALETPVIRLPDGTTINTDRRLGQRRAVGAAERALFGKTY